MKAGLSALLALTIAVPSVLSAATLSTQLAGRILLAVEDHGEAWYVDPVSLTRTYLSRPDDALSVMRAYGLGITNSDLTKIPESNEQAVGDWALRHRLSGRILLQVQGHGEAWYVDPVSLRRIYLGRPEEAFRVMSGYGLGISNADLNTIPTAPASPMHNTTAITNHVPFSTQAPLGDWNDPRQQDGCEEAAVLMALAWANNTTLSASATRDAIIAMSDWEKSEFGYYQDTGLRDTAQRLIKEYSDFNNYEIGTPADTGDLIEILNDGHIAIVPINGRAFVPFHYTPPGPERHMIVVHGYNPATDTFSVHDPGTSQGANLQVTAANLAKAWRDYASGEQVTIPNLPNSLIIIKR